MAEAALAQRSVTGAVRPPPAPVLWTIVGAAGCAVSRASFSSANAGLPFTLEVRAEIPCA